MRKNLFLDIVIVFILLGAYSYFFPDYISGPGTIVVVALMAKFIIGTHWKDSFKLGLINFVWIFIVSFLIFAQQISSMFSANQTNDDFVLPLFIIVMGSLITYITLTWTGSRRIPYSLFDKLIFNIFGQHKPQPNPSSPPKWHPRGPRRGPHGPGIWRTGKRHGGRGDRRGQRKRWKKRRYNVKKGF